MSERRAFVLAMLIMAPIAVFMMSRGGCSPGW